MATLATMRFRLRQEMGDTDPDQFAVSSPRVHRLLLDKSLDFGAKAGYGEAWTTSVLTLSDTGSSDFQFASGIQYSTVKHLRRASDGRILNRWPADVIESLREGSPLATGKPEAFYFIESTATRLTARFWPRPNTADTVDALISRLPTNSALPEDTIQFSDNLISAIIKSVAAGIVLSSNAATLDRLQLTKEWAALREAEAQALLSEEKKRMDRLKRTDKIAVAWAG